MTLSLCCIVKNEEANLERCLSSVRGVFDQIVIVDTGSTDKTVEVAKNHGANVFHFDWVDDFSAARNFSFSKSTCDYIMWLDADDEILPQDRDKILALKQQLCFDAYLMAYNYAQDEFGRCSVRLFRHRIIKRGVATWMHPIHECMSFKPDFTQAQTDIVVTHRRTGADAARDQGRNIRLLSAAIKKSPDDVRLRFYYAKELFSEGRLQECLDAFKVYLQNPGWHDDTVNTYWYMSMAHLQLGREDAAIESCLHGIKLDPRFAEFYATIGQIHYNHERWGQAIPWFELTSRCKVPEAFGLVLQDNYTWVPWDRLAKCYSQVGRVQEAYDANEKALAFRPEDTRLQFNREFLRDILFPGRKMEEPVRLSLGSGGKPTCGYKNTDLFPGPNIQEVFDQSAIPYIDGSVHAIYSEHALEHVGHTQADRTVAEWARVLRRGGDLVLKVPDLELCARNYLQAEDQKHKEWFKYTIYGIQDVTGVPHPEGQYHKTGFSKDDLQRLLHRHGFFIGKMENYDGWDTPSVEVRATLEKKPLKVAWLIPGKSDPDNASLRIRCLKVHVWLRDNGVDSQLVDNYRANDPWPVVRFADVVVMIGFGPQEKALIARLRRAGVAVVFDHCEDLEGLPDQQDCFGNASLVVCCSSVLTEKAEKLYGRAETIVDAYEPGPGTHDYRQHGAKLRVVWCGHGGNAGEAQALKPIIEKLGMELQIISEWPEHDKKWNRETWLDDLNAADIVICPQRHWLQPAKSNNRATQAMSIGLPVLASPIAAYKEAIVDGQTGFICSTPEEWADALRLCQDQTTRERIGKAAKAAAVTYSIDTVGKEWLTLLERLAEENCRPPAADIIIPTWNNLPLLQECIKSIRANTAWPHQIYVISSGTDGTKAWLDQQPDIVSIYADTRLHFSAANNEGLKRGTNPYVCLLNDDTIVAKGWLQALMQEAMKPGVGAVNPFSNCDKGWLHDEIFTVDGVQLVPGMALEQVRSVIPRLYEAKHEKVVTEREWVAFFATVIPREAIEKVGFLDEQFKSGCEDLDYCRRLRNAGYKFVTTYDAFVFHFGGATRKRADAQDREKNQREDQENQAKLAAKYGCGAELRHLDIRPRNSEVELKATPEHGPSAAKRGDRPIFCLYTGPAWEKWGPHSINQGGIGGSETCAVYVAREFAKRGYNSYVFADCDEALVDDVQYVPWQKFPNYLGREIDIFVSSRRPEVFELPIKARKKICWVHDIWLHNDPSANIWPDRVDEYFCLSPWHRDFFCSHHKVAREKVWVTRDGIDLKRFDHFIFFPEHGNALTRERGRMIYTSSPDRGLDVLLDCFPRIRKQLPSANLHVFYGFENWEKAIQQRGNKTELAWMENLKSKLKQPGVTYHGRVGQADLAYQFMRSELWAYPTYFTETYCISAMEAAAAGLPMITSDLAALHTTVGDAGILLPGEPQTEMYQDRFVQECVSMLTDYQKWQRYSAKSIAKASTCGWESVVNEWCEHLK